MGISGNSATTRTMPSRRRAIAALAAFVLALLIGTAGPASAHATLLFASPSADGGVATSPNDMVLTFDSPVTLQAQALRASGPSGSAVPLGTPTLSTDRHTMQAALSAPIGIGVYTVTWQVTASDGDAVTGTYRFAVGPAAAGLSSSPHTVQAPGALSTGIARWLLFAALAAIAGSAVTPRLAARARVSIGTSRRYGQAVAVAALTGLLAALWLLAIQLGGGNALRGVTHMCSDAFANRPATIVTIEAVAFAAVALLALLRRWVPAARQTAEASERTSLARLNCGFWTLIPITVIVGAESIRAHPREYGSFLGAATTFVHLASVALWLGALAHAVAFAITGRHDPKAVRRLWRAYARMAAVLLAAVLVSGVTAGLIVVPLSDLLGTGYGQLLLVKAGLVAVAAGLAAAARWRLRTKLLVLPIARVEAAVLAVVLAASATLTALAPPKTGTGDLAVPPPASGPVESLGARTGQVGIDVQASDGLLVVYLTAPGADETAAADQGTPEGGAAAAVVNAGPATSYRLAVVAADPSGTTRKLSLRGCGSGCYVAPMAWANGDSILTLSAGADTWTGGRTTVAVSWPPTPGDTALAKLTAALANTPHLTVIEQVSSDTTASPTAPRTLDLSGPYFLNAEPYGSGKAPQATLIPGPGGGSTLLLGYPAEHITVRLVLDNQGHLVRETLTDPDHVTVRTFVYPETGG
ncbi:copper resistance CopC/CopD family protein [Catenulispora rubra]|uniref:copper resistance CopC/CopD family protein n=1 Tax=Catenulispora rubra TaxID=280293 RepID=UPI001892059B|nr:copper resistance protein CopC [Catenulispora rubra]